MGTRQRSAGTAVWRGGIAAAVILGACASLPQALAHDPPKAQAAGDRKGDAPAHPPGRKSQVGIASVYARMLDGRPTASGELHDSDELVAAHRTLPLGTEVRVTNLSNHRSVVVRINDRGPQIRSRIIDLSPRAAAAIGLRARGKGITRVRVDILREPEPEATVAKARDTDKARANAARAVPRDQVADASSPLP